MYQCFEDGIVKSGNLVRLESPILLNNKAGKIVADEADAFGRAVTIRHILPENVLVTDETGSNTREMGDDNDGGQRYMAPCGKTPRYEASIRDSHSIISAPMGAVPSAAAAGAPSPPSPPSPVFST